MFSEVEEFSDEDWGKWAGEEEEEEWEAVWRRAHAAPAWLDPAEGEQGEPPLAPLLMRHFGGRRRGAAPFEQWQLVSPRLYITGLPHGFRESELIDLLTQHGGTGARGRAAGSVVGAPVQQCFLPAVGRMKQACLLQRASCHCA